MNEKNKYDKFFFFIQRHLLLLHRISCCSVENHRRVHLSLDNHKTFCCSQRNSMVSEKKCFKTKKKRHENCGRQQKEREKSLRKKNSMLVYFVIILDSIFCVFLRVTSFGRASANIQIVSFFCYISFFQFADNL